MSLDALTNPAERLEYLPTAMNWKGAWSALTQYYVNDVVLSTINGDSYLATTNILGGVDPATATTSVWTSLSGIATGGSQAFNGGTLSVAVPALPNTPEPITFAGNILNFLPKTNAVYLCNVECDVATTGVFSDKVTVQITMGTIQTQFLTTSATVTAPAGINDFAINCVGVLQTGDAVPVAGDFAGIVECGAVANIGGISFKNITLTRIL